MINLGKAPVTAPIKGAVSGSGACKRIGSDSLDRERIAREFKVIDWRTAKDGYNAECGCYCWGYQPPSDQVKLIGIPTGYVRTNFPVCLKPCPAPAPPPCPVCPPAPKCPTCPPEKVCPTCQTCKACPKPEPCPVCPPAPPCPTCEAAELAPRAEPSKFGLYLGLVAAAAAVGGGLYLWKKV